MSLRMRRRLEKLEVEAGRVRRIRLYWVDPETGNRTLIAGG
jgi:hypothetical protein